GLTNVVGQGGRAHPEWLHPYSYFRGLDGERPLLSEDKGAPRDAEGSEKKARPRPDPKQLEHAEGDSQFDYLRRLADRIERTDAQLRQTGSKIDVIGVVGNDVYDKLLILQAMRPRFPDTLFFTNDYDERLLHPAERAWTQRLLVASSFGTQLR